MLPGQFPGRCLWMRSTRYPFHRRYSLPSRCGRYNRSLPGCGRYCLRCSTTRCIQRPGCFLLSYSWPQPFLPPPARCRCSPSCLSLHYGFPESLCSDDGVRSPALFSQKLSVCTVWKGYRGRRSPSLLRPGPLQPGRCCCSCNPSIGRRSRRSRGLWCHRPSCCVWHYCRCCCCCYNFPMYPYKLFPPILHKSPRKVPAAPIRHPTDWIHFLYCLLP